MALAAMIAGPTAQEAETTLTLACKGTATIKSASEYVSDPLSMGLIVDFAARTVQGTARWGPFLFDDKLQITEANDGTIVFSGFSKFLGMKIVGSMDRVTGNVGMLATAEGWSSYDYSLKCTPTQRMF